ncbi:hypothetical protein [Caudoviricetes sp.]|nr:hypothetical protein [Caudoviricetes sp.]
MAKAPLTAWERLKIEVTYWSVFTVVLLALGTCVEVALAFLRGPE